MIYIGIIGSRRRNTEHDFQNVYFAFQQVFHPQAHKFSEVVIVSGGCKQGGDLFAETLIKVFRTQKIIHLPDESKLDPALPRRIAYAKIAYARNSLIARDAKDYLIACVAHDRKGGTEDTIEKWQKIHGEKGSKKGKLILV